MLCIGLHTLNGVYMPIQTQTPSFMHVPEVTLNLISDVIELSASRTFSHITYDCESR